MSAIEYGSYYWCVFLNGDDADTPGDSVHLHADDLAIESNGALIFRSAGRRPPGAPPKQPDAKESAKPPNKDEKSDKTDKENQPEGDMIYIAFAPGTWRLVYAAKLLDGSPASVEHWTTANGKSVLSEIIPPDLGAADAPPRN